MSFHYAADTNLKAQPVFVSHPPPTPAPYTPLRLNQFTSGPSKPQNDLSFPSTVHKETLREINTLHCDCYKKKILMQLSDFKCFPVCESPVGKWSSHNVLFPAPHSFPETKVSRERGVREVVCAEECAHGGVRLCCSSEIWPAAAR